jgi:hypothetical protein
VTARDVVETPDAAGVPEVPAPVADVVALLLGAAERIEGLAGEVRAYEGGWTFRSTDYGRADLVQEAETGWTIARVGHVGAGIAEWISTMNPAVAPHLAAWLREVAWRTRRILDLHTDEPSRARIAEAHFANPGVAAAVGLARLVLPGWASGGSAPERGTRADLSAEQAPGVPQGAPGRSEGSNAATQPGDPGVSPGSGHERPQEARGGDSGVLASPREGDPDRGTEALSGSGGDQGLQEVVGGDRT